jgi:hypothetical protein
VNEKANILRLKNRNSRKIKFLNFRKFVLSTDLNYLYYFLFLLPVVICSIATYFLYLINYQHLTNIVLFEIIIFTFFCLVFGGTKNVWFDHDNLYVKNWFKNDKIPLEDILKV